MPEQTLGGIPLGLGMVMKINFLNFHVRDLSERSCSCEVSALINMAGEDNTGFSLYRVCSISLKQATNVI